VVEELLHPGRDEVSRRVAAGVHEQEEEELELPIGQPVTVGLRLHERRGDVVTGRLPLGVDDHGGVGEHLRDRAQAVLA
jgi:hypothetical protein